MGKLITIDQSHEVMHVLACNVDWETLEPSTIQRIIDNPREAGRQFSVFLRSGAQLNVNAFLPRQMLTCSRPFDPVAFIGTGWSVAEQDERTLKLTTLDITKISFETCLKQGEHRITGEEKLARLKARPDLVPLGAPQCQALWEDYKANGAHSLLEWLRQEKGITYLDFFGTILRDPGGDRGVLCLCWGDGGWSWGCRWLGSDWGAGCRSAALARSELGT